MEAQKQIEIDRITLMLTDAMFLHPYSVLKSIAHCLGRIRITEMNEDFSLLDDESIMRLIQQGDHGAFSEIVHRHAKRFYSISYRILFNKHDAEDIVQEAFLRLWEKSNLWNPHRKAKFTTWFYKVVVNLCLDHNRKKVAMHLTEEIKSTGKTKGGEEILNEKQRQEILNRCLQELPDQQRLALNLCFYEGLSNQEAADIIGVKIKALQSLIMRAKTTLKEKVKHYF